VRPPELLAMILLSLVSTYRKRRNTRNAHDAPSSCPA
jgi:hypothetical protein